MGAKDILKENGFVDENDFIPLDEDIKNEIERLKKNSAKLARSWKKRTYILPEDLYESLSDWKKDLNTPCVYAYCAAVEALIRSLIIDASVVDEPEATVLIELPKELPNLYVFAQPGSILAQEEGLNEETSARGIHMCLGARPIGAQIALRCDKPSEWGELAWRALCYSIATRKIDDPFSRIAIRRIKGIKGGKIELTLKKED